MRPAGRSANERCSACAVLLQTPGQCPRSVPEYPTEPVGIAQGCRRYALRTSTGSSSARPASRRVALVLGEAGPAVRVLVRGASRPAPRRTCRARGRAVSSGPHPIGARARRPGPTARAPVRAGARRAELHVAERVDVDDRRQQPALLDRPGGGAATGPATPGRSPDRGAPATRRWRGARPPARRCRGRGSWC